MVAWADPNAILSARPEEQRGSSGSACPGQGNEIETGTEKHKTNYVVEEQKASGRQHACVSPDQATETK